MSGQRGRRALRGARSWERLRGRTDGAPILAALCSPGRARFAAAALALALARAHGVGCALAAAEPTPPPTSSVAPAALRAAAALRRSGCAASAVGRLVWVGRAADDDHPGGVDGRAVADGARLEAVRETLAAATELTGTPAVLAVSVPRSEDVDRVLARHDGIVIVREPELPSALAALARVSAAALGPPAAELRVPSRFAERLARAGVREPAEASALVARLTSPDAS